MARLPVVLSRSLHDWPHPAWCDWRNCRIDESYGEGLTLVSHSNVVHDADGWVVELHAADLCRGADAVQTGTSRISIVHGGDETLLDITTAAQLASALVLALAATVQPPMT